MTRDELYSILAKLRAGYQPSPSVLEHIGKLTFVIIVGPSGVGKTSLMKKLPYHFVVGDTTRTQRLDEENGTDYHFRMDYSKIFEEIHGRIFVQFEIGPAGDFYGTRSSSYPDKGIAMMAIVAQGVANFRLLGFKETITAFIVPPNYGEFKKRLDTKKLDGTSLARRLKEAKISLEWALEDADTHFILNDDLDAAVLQVKDLVKDKIHEDDEAKARQAAKNILNGLS